jgi:hypothetical protein
VSPTLEPTVPFIDPGLVQELNLDGSPNSLQRVEAALHQRFDSHAALLAHPGSVASLIDYLHPIFLRFAGCQPVSGEPGVMCDRQGLRVDLHALLREVFERGNGQVLFMACYQRLSCIPHD